MSKNIKQKSTIYEEYLEYYEKFKNKYGEKAVVLIKRDYNRHSS